jgi:hypothetical protein
MRSQCCYICFSQLPQSQLQLVKIIVDIALIQVIIVTSWYPRTPFYHAFLASYCFSPELGSFLLG